MTVTTDQLAVAMSGIGIGLCGWALLKVVSLSERIAGIEATDKATDKRIEELCEKIDEMHTQNREDLKLIHHRLDQLVKHDNKRAGR